MTYDWELRAQQNCYWKVRINHGARRYKEAEIDKKKKKERMNATKKLKLNIEVIPHKKGIDKIYKQKEENMHIKEESYISNLKFK